MQMSATTRLNLGLRVFFCQFVRVSLRRLACARMAREGVHVPPIAIFSITNGCNLRCKG